MTLDELTTLIAAAWPARYERGRILHIHRNDVARPDGSTIHLRVLIQTVADAPTKELPPWQKP